MKPCKVYFLSVILLLSSFLLTQSIMSEWIELIYPLGDEFTIIVNSKGRPTSWLLEGYSNYFNVYPEFYEPKTNFIRPVANLIYFCFSQSNDFFKNQLIYANYGAHSLIVFMIFIISYYLGNSIFNSFLLTIIAYLAPAFWGTWMTIYPSYALDGIAAAFCLIGVWLSFGRSWWIGVLLLGLAVFTKESALPVVVAVSLYYFFINKKSIALSTASIVLSWFILRYAAFNTFGGVYPFEASYSPFSIITKAKGIFLLPLGGFGKTISIKEILHGEAKIGQLLFYATNAFLNSFVFFQAVKNRKILSKAFRKIKHAQDKNINKEKVYLLSLFILILFCGYFCLTIIETRFTYIYFIFFLIVLAVKNKSAINSISLIFISLLCGFSFVTYKFDLDRKKEVYKMNYDASRNLVEKLRGVKTSGKPIFIANDFVSGHSPSNIIAKYSGVDGEFYRASSISSNCTETDLRLSSANLLKDSSGSIILETKLNDCAHFYFESTSSKKIIDHLFDGVIERNEYISYSFPDPLTAKRIFSKEKGIGNLKRNMTIKLSEAELIYYEFKRGSWVHVE